jgi:hypothetical protein
MSKIRTTCEHEKRKDQCVICNDCGHGKLKYICKECGGSQICEHNKIKSRCKECGGSQICEHGIYKTGCKECGGSQICEHKKHKSRCKECGGSQICQHNKNKAYCKECGGKTFCEHKKEKRNCKDCNGNNRCIHDKLKRWCRECDGSAFCIHDKDKTLCKECGGSQVCIHNKRKHYCKECGGSSLCQHNIIKRTCKLCNGNEICEHDKRKQYCKECGGSALCKTPLCETFSNAKYKGHCLTCFIHLFPDEPNVRNYKTKEKDVVDRIIQTFTNFTWVADKKVQDGCSRRRPDLLLDMGSHIIIIEIDENKHTDYDCSCEHKRLMELSLDLQHRPIVFIRFNPDDYTNEEGILVKSCWKLNKLGVMQITITKQKEWEERIETLKKQIQYWIDNPTEKTIEIIELFY